MNVIFFGSPGAGKGTQSALLAQKQGLKHISTGDLLRQALGKKTPIGMQAQSYMEQGQLVPDDIVIELVNEALGKLEGGFVLDGFPRRVVQAEALEDQLACRGLTLDKSIFLDVPQVVLMRRLMGRRVCRDCGVNYHIESHPPKKEGICDYCGGGPVTRRSDDSESAIDKRLEVYGGVLESLKRYFEKKGVLVTVDGTGDKMDVFHRVLSVLE